MKHRLCLGCSLPLNGRSDAKTCSAKCRKRFQRAKISYRDLLLADEHQIGYEMRSSETNEVLRGRQYAGR
ncbi:DUF2116 family Zn-ribbon domain-containing protein [Candidatus Saccharibacteria bacterium]|nr:DUF2116 family Zn-ribbon domain-containing protein [Candidatus Saccharibacteria bacterium]